MDLEKFFDLVDHRPLMTRLARTIKDRRVLRLIRRYLKAEMVKDGQREKRQAGMPQGGPLSLLLSNILLDELDKELERRGHSFCRYADDCNIYVSSRKAGDHLLKNIRSFVENKQNLTVNQKKSAGARPGAPGELFWREKTAGPPRQRHGSLLGPSSSSSPRFPRRINAKAATRYRAGQPSLMPHGRRSEGWAARPSAATQSRPA